jgi:hypothetical protein
MSTFRLGKNRKIVEAKVMRRQMNSNTGDNAKITDINR